MKKKVEKTNVVSTDEIKKQYKKARRKEVVCKIADGLLEGFAMGIAAMTAGFGFCLAVGLVNQKVKK
jgi:hypothetical protein